MVKELMRERMPMVIVAHGIRVKHLADVAQMKPKMASRTIDWMDWEGQRKVPMENSLVELVDRAKILLEG
jgi:hypothetical protein